MADVPDDAAPEEPVPPEDSMCCGSGCEFCVWTTYFAELAAYRQALADWQARQGAAREGLNG
ncbi:oxidoreductase-like domain-containing protein [Paludibacterium purpuratum]|uniref:Oxidoreductase family protein n=1 Tax=Paludibacterium purpuratum TaxID=1144873 RepID=A0A4R7BEG6_9NEIS|nr:oxidoreductase-like domain-containing protein [Paludibacterium purpuratum]TDR82642.1 oxidoreductase family protein [Paludibacterium purpuratum]